MPRSRYSNPGPTSTWIALNLNLNPRDVRLFIQARKSVYSHRTKSYNESLSHLVEYYHKKKGIIRITPRDIISRDQVLKEYGYGARKFRAFVKNFRQSQ